MSAVENKSDALLEGRIIVRSKKLAGEQGFEPWLAESESAVLPLDDSPISLKRPTITSVKYCLSF